VEGGRVDDVADDMADDVADDVADDAVRGLPLTSRPWVSLREAGVARGGVAEEGCVYCLHAVLNPKRSEAPAAGAF